MQGEERESCEHIHFAKYHPQEQRMLFKMYLRMKYVLQDHNQSRKVPHLETQVNRIMLQKLPTNNVCNKPDHKDLWACKTGHNAFLEFLPSLFWWHLTPNRSQVLHHMSIFALKIEHNEARKCTPPAGFFFSLFLYKTWKKIQQTAPPSTLLGIHHFHTLQHETAQLGSNTVAESQWAASCWLSCLFRPAVHNLFLSLTIPWHRTVHGELWSRRLRTPGAHPREQGEGMCEHTPS